MRFRETELPGAYVIQLERLEDERGFFARTFCETEFAALGLTTRFPQCNISYNRSAGTLRGMHYQAAPHGEEKLVRCSRGALHDVIVDLRPASPNHLKWVAVRLTAEERTALYIPKGFAHGFLTLEPDTEVFYQMGAAYRSGAGRGLRWDDPGIGIRWPSPPAVVSVQDSRWPDFDPRAFDG